MSRQHDRGDLPPEVRIRMAEDDLDRVDEKFGQVDEKINHKAANLDIAIRGVASQVKSLDDELTQKYEKLETKTAEEIGGNRKIMVGVLLSALGTAIAIVAAVLTVRGGG